LEKCYIIDEEKNSRHAVKRRKAIWIGHILRRNCILKHVTEVKIEGRGRRVRRHKQLLDDFKETKGWWKLK
jgi:hypothetical protein